MTRMKYIVYYSFCLLVITASCGQNTKNNQKDESNPTIEIPDSLSVEKVEKVNFNNATIEIYTTSSRADHDKIYEFWYKDKEQIHFASYPFYEINYRWLVDLNGDDNIEVVRAQGYEDGVNYGIYTTKENSEKLLLNFNPALLDERYPNQVFWGYPWDMERLVVNSKKQILASYRIPYERDDNYSMAVNQKQMPFIFFYGKTTQAFAKVKMEPSQNEFMTLKKMITKSFQANQDEYQVPVDSYIYDSVLIEINNSSYKIVSVEKLSEKNNKSNSHFGLPIIVLQNNSLIEKNSDVVFGHNDNCPAEGYGRMYVEGNYFTIQQIFCSDFLFVRSQITFKIDAKNNEIILHEYVEEYTDRSNPDRPIPAKIWTSKDFGKVLFRETTESFLTEISQTNPE